MIEENKVRKKTNLSLATATPSLAAHAQHLKSFNLRELFALSPLRAQEMFITCGDLTLDFSHQCITTETLDVFAQHAEQSQLCEKIKDLLSGDLVNPSEQQPALHTALRDPSPAPILVNGENVKLAIQATLLKMNNLCTYFWDMGIQDVLVMGIGGSYWGPRCVYEALQMLPKRVNVHFLADMEEEAFISSTQSLCPEKTAVLVISKSFTTRETLCNFERARSWLGNHFKTNILAITAATDKAEILGIDASHILEIWSWVGGRYSIWSSVGLPIALCYGMEVFQSLLAGAHQMDRHLLNTDPRNNAPMMAAFLTFLNTCFFETPTEAVIPYGFQLQSFIPYIQQLSMESLGKCHDIHGNPIIGATGPIIWGQTGLHAQHTFNQLLHQGQHRVAVDFILPMNKPELTTNCFAQSEALAFGDMHHPLKFARIPGNQPHNILKIEALSPHTLGLLLAFYEHKTYLLSCLFNINAFDQFGVELAKKIMSRLV